jgi:hypothetical protein
MCAILSGLNWIAADSNGLGKHDNVLTVITVLSCAVENQPPTCSFAQSLSNSQTGRMVHYCAHCNYKSPHRWNVIRHQSRKHKLQNKEVVEHPTPMQSEEQLTDLEFMEDSIQVFKIYKLLQRMKNK